MFLEFIADLFSGFLFFALHINSPGVFPKPLSAKEEEECFRLMAEGDISARNKLIEHNLRLVAHIIKKYGVNIREQEDLISVGTIGLIKATTTFDYTKGTKFATYASRCIENEILMTFRAQKKSAGDIYIDEPIETDKDGNQLTLMDVVADSENIPDAVELSIRSEQLSSFLEKCLDERELLIISERYGLNGKKPLTQREIAKKLGISRSYVSRIEKKALAALRYEFEHASPNEKKNTRF